jgi:hypothetical protein
LKPNQPIPEFKHTKNCHRQMMNAEWRWRAVAIVMPICAGEHDGSAAAARSTYGIDAGPLAGEVGNPRPARVVANATANRRPSAQLPNQRIKGRQLEEAFTDEGKNFHVRQ